MSGNRDFDPAKFVAMVGYMWRRAPMPAYKLAWLAMYADFDAYRQLGRAITGATYVRGAVHPEVREMGEGWFERFVWAQLPWWARCAGRGLALAALARAVRSRS